jgi:hypothetical protein
MSINKLHLFCLVLLTLLSKTLTRPLGGSIYHNKLTPKSLAYHKIIPNSKHDRIKTNRKLSIELKDDPEEEVDWEEQQEEEEDEGKTVGQLEEEIDEAIHANDHLEHHEEDAEVVDTDDGQEEESGSEREGDEEETGEGEEGEEEERNDGTKLEDEIVGVEIYKMEHNLEIYRDLIIDCIDREYAKNMFMDQDLVVMICLGERYEIIQRIYHNYLEKIHTIFDKIWKHKVKHYRDTYRDDILLFFNIVRMITLKDLHLRKTLEVAEHKIKYTLDPDTYKLIMEDISKEIDAYDEIRDKLMASKHKIQEHLDEREREKQEEEERLKQLEGVEEEQEIKYEHAHPDEIDEEEGHEKEEFDDGYEEEATNLEDVSEEEATPEEETEEAEDLSIDENDSRGQYDSEDASVGPEGDPTPSMNSSQRQEALKNPHEPSPDSEVEEIKVDPN